MIVLIALIALIVVGWYCYRWGHANGSAAGYDAGHAAGLRECKPRA